MADKKDSITDVLKQIQQFYQSKEYHELKVLSERMTLMNLFKKSRAESIHSAMIAWCFSNKEFQMLPESPVIFLLRLLAVNAESQKETYLSSEDKNKGGRNRFIKDDTLWNNIVSNAIHLKVDEVKTEEKTKGDEDGRVDIVILCTLDNGNKLRICIENKVDTDEHSHQCRKYYEYYEKDTSRQTIYVFLAPKYPSKLSSNHYIIISYQELLDAILYPLLEYRQKYSERTAFYLEEYINTITSIKTNKILAMSDEYKKLLKDFFNNNQKIIYAALDAVGGKEIEEQVDKVRGGTNAYNLVIDGKAQIVNGYSKLGYEIARYLAKNMSKEDLIKDFGELKATDKYYILKEDKKDESGKKRYTGEEITCKDDKKVWCSNDWRNDKVEALKTLLEDKNIPITFQSI